MVTESRRSRVESREFKRGIWTGTALLLLALSAGLSTAFAQAVSEQHADLNNVLYASAFPGADIGAQITNAIAACGTPPCEIWVTQPGTISNPPDVPQGYTLHFVPGNYTLTTTWYIKHSGTIFDFDGAIFDDPQDSAGSYAIVVGKDSSGTVNTSGTSVTWVSGTKFSDMDVNDVIVINGQSFNVDSVDSSTQITLAPGSNAGTQTGATYFGLMLNNVNATYSSTVVLRDLNLIYTGPGSVANNGILFDGVIRPEVDDVRADWFDPGVGWTLDGTLEGEFHRLQADFNGTNLILDRVSNFSGSNLNAFYSPSLEQNQVASGHALEILNSSTQNLFVGADIESNLGTVAVSIDPTSQQNVFRDCDFEINGDGTANSADVVNNASYTSFEDDSFSSAPANHPASGIVSNAGNGVMLRNLNFNGSYTASYNFTGGTGKIENVVTVGSATDSGVREDSSGDYVLKNLTIGGDSGPSWTSGSGAPSGACITGSLYSNTSGGSGTTLYACQTGAWAAK